MIASTVVVGQSSAQQKGSEDAIFLKEEKQKIVVIISHLDTTNIEISDIKQLYSMKRKLLPDGNRAVLTMLPIDTKESVYAFKYLIGLYPYQMQRIWDRAVFSGKGTSPSVFTSSSEIVSYIANNTNTIGFTAVNTQSELSKLKEIVNVIAIVE
ncbi:MAG: hypothetical protein WA981_15270 [Glaciecola sp.]